MHNIFTIINTKSNIELFKKRNLKYLQTHLLINSEINSTQKN